MRIAVPAETAGGERRVAFVLESCRRLILRIALVICLLFLRSTVNASTGSLPAPPDVCSTNHIAELTLTAVTDSTGHAALSFNGGIVPPTRHHLIRQALTTWCGLLHRPR